MIARMGFRAGILNEKVLFSFYRNDFPPKEHEEPTRPCVMGRFQFVMITCELQSTTTSAWKYFHGGNQMMH